VARAARPALPRRRRRALVALLLLGASWALDRVAVAAGPTGDRADVADTHQRLDRIYRELGIERAAPQQQPGCGPLIRPAEGSSARLPSWLGYLLLALVIAAMLVPLLLALRGALGRQRGDGLEDLAAEDEPPPFEAWGVTLADCRALVVRGELAAACAGLHRLALLELERRGQLQLARTTTNWEYVRRLASRPALRQLLAELTEAAERAVLARRPPPEERYRQLEQRLLQQLPAEEAR